jgi:RimJ/RimL family protein N-acetyltransferase
LATEAARAAPEYAFDAGLFRRIYARTDVPNSASVPAMERLGMKFEREIE